MTNLENILEVIVDHLIENYNKFKWYKWCHAGGSSKGFDYDDGHYAYFRCCELIKCFDEGVFGIRISLKFQGSWDEDENDINPYERNCYFTIKITDYYCYTRRKHNGPFKFTKDDEYFSKIKKLFESIWGVAFMSDPLHKSHAVDSLRTIAQVIKNNV